MKTGVEVHRSETTAAIAGEVRALVARNRTRQADLCELLHLSQGSISLRLSGKIPFTLDELVALATFFEVAPGQMLQQALERWPAAAAAAAARLQLPRLDSNQQPFGSRFMQVSEDLEALSAAEGPAERATGTVARILGPIQTVPADEPDEQRFAEIVHLGTWRRARAGRRKSA